jgi:hypothetical protein
VEGELIGPIRCRPGFRKAKWYQLTVECRGSKLRALLDEREVIPWTEPSLVPFPDGSSKGVFPSGKVAFWTKADSVAYFADTRLDFTPRELFAQTLVRETIQANPRLLGLKIFGLATNDTGTKIIASNDHQDVGQPGDKVERRCIEKGGSYFGKNKNQALRHHAAARSQRGNRRGRFLAMTTFWARLKRTRWRGPCRS